jgi:hypothetical protein
MPPESAIPISAPAPHAPPDRIDSVDLDEQEDNSPPLDFARQPTLRARRR